MVYDKVKELGKDIDKIVVDDFIHQGDNEERVKRFGKYLECFGNGGKIKDLMEQIIQKCGDLDASPITMKHTSYYDNAKK